MLKSALRLCAVLLAAAATLATAAYAQTVPPGWKVTKSATQWVATSPDQGRGLTVKLVYYAAHKPTGALDLWFPEAHQRVAWQYGEIMNIGRIDTLEQPGLSRLVASSISVKPKTGGRTSVIAYAYDTGQGREMILIVLPSTLGKKNPAYRAAFAAMNDFWRGGQLYVPGS